MFTQYDVSEGDGIDGVAWDELVKASLCRDLDSFHSPVAVHELGPLKQKVDLGDGTSLR